MNTNGLEVVKYQSVKVGSEDATLFKGKYLGVKTRDWGGWRNSTDPDTLLDP